MCYNSVLEAGRSGLQTPDVLLHKGFDPGAEEPVVLYRKGLTDQRAALASRPATISERRKDEVTRLKSCKVGLLFLSFVFSSSHLSSLVLVIVSQMH